MDKELTAEQEDIMLEAGMEEYYEQKQRLNDNAEHITKRCVKCREATDFNCDEWIELDFKGSGEWVCGECYNELKLK